MLPLRLFRIPFLMCLLCVHAWAAAQVPAAMPATAPVPAAVPAPVAESSREYVLGSGDIVRISVFQNPDLTTEGRVSETGALTFPLIGSVPLGGRTVSAAEALIAERLREGGFVLQPQVTVLPVQIRGNQVAVLGHVNKPGRYPLDTFNVRVTDMLANAGGIATGGDDVIVLVGTRDGQRIRRELDLPALFQRGDADADVLLSPGDVIYARRADVFYIYGEVQKPGAFRLERNMTVMQALATGGGPTLRGTVRGLRIHRRDQKGSLAVIEPSLEDRLRPDDIIYVKESLF
ncbi:polysaccharide export outer membrane protein [Aromatoleum tolulyticum]|uniref:Polysaccharide export outer membrane protein n=1 Tax=Aromatoleum tolulyticum TaxID=34027 RepID=A0A1N6SKN9_9RHOO|nr:polysaccharide export protein EpsE [Aromatoleum tolulyticum]SIQ41532.1 polysaccharide export outer membrane protein [Aromatoleum tolulyticum]